MRPAEEAMTIARDVLGIADKKLNDATDWLRAPDVSATDDQRARMGAALRRIEAAKAAIREADRLIA